MSGIPPELKKMKRFIREATKTQKVKPVISYYCRLYAIQEAMNLPNEKKSEAVNKWLGVQMGLLEQTQQKSTREDAQQEILDMADTVFKHANKVDLEGNANKQTAAAFNSAFVFYEILKQFGERGKEVEERAKYSMFKTTDILKALREGRKPEPGPPGGLKDEFGELGENSTTESGGGGGGGGGSDEFSQPQSQPSPQPQSQPQPQPQPPQPNNNPYYGGNMNNMNNMNNSYSNTNNQFSNNNMNNQFNSPNSNTNMGYSNNNNNNNNWSQPKTQPKPQPKIQSKTYDDINSQDFRKFESKVIACSEAEKIMKHAFSAMKFNDVNTAIDKLREAIGILTPYKN